MRNVEFLPSIVYELVVKRFPLFRLEKKAKALLNKIGIEEFKNYRNWKRSASGARALPLINFTALEILIMRLFFQRRILVKGKPVVVRVDNSATEGEPFFGTLVRVRIRVLMSIGSRSGLWYLDKKVTD
jgi:hypothetical protein